MPEDGQNYCCTLMRTRLKYFSFKFPKIESYFLGFTSFLIIPEEFKMYKIFKLCALPFLSNNIYGSRDQTEDSNPKIKMIIN